MIHVVDHAWLKTVQANKTKTAKNLLRRKKSSELLFVSQAVLQCEQRGPLPHKWRQKAGKALVGGRFEPDENEVAWADFLWVARTPGLDAKITLRAADENAFAAHAIEIGAQEEMNLLTGTGQLGAVEASDGSTPDNSDLHSQQKRHPEQPQSA
jgi:hypothetical protein